MPLDHGFERTFVTALRGLDIMSPAQKAWAVQAALGGHVARLQLCVAQRVPSRRPGGPDRVVRAA